MHDRVWRFPPPGPLPSPERLGKWSYGHGERWMFDPWCDIIPNLPLHSADLLKMLWATELQSECYRHRIATTARSTRFTMIREMALMMTGREVAQAVCRQLRARTFAEADPPIPIPPAGAASTETAQQSPSGGTP
jgi:hypothetical protein